VIHVRSRLACAGIPRRHPRRWWAPAWRFPSVPVRGGSRRPEISKARFPSSWRMNDYDRPHIPATPLFWGGTAVLHSSRADA